MNHIMATAEVSLTMLLLCNSVTVELVSLSSVTLLTS
jgi:hypothetical protein